MLPVTMPGMDYLAILQINYWDDFQLRLILKIFVCEFITGGGLYRELLPTSLAAEGALIRDALLEDLAALPDIEVVTTCDARLAAPNHALVIPVNLQDDVWEVWDRCIENS